MTPKETKKSLDAFILNSLCDGDKYGHEIARIISDNSDSYLYVKISTVYSALKKLEAQGYVEPYWGDESQGGRRLYYRLTKKGKNYCEENAIELIIKPVDFVYNDGKSKTERAKKKNLSEVSFDQEEFEKRLQVLSLGTGFDSKDTNDPNETAVNTLNENDIKGGFVKEIEINQTDINTEEVEDSNNEFIEEVDYFVAGSDIEVKEIEGSGDEIIEEMDEIEDSEKYSVEVKIPDNENNKDLSEVNDFEETTFNANDKIDCFSSGIGEDVDGIIKDFEENHIKKTDEIEISEDKTNEVDEIMARANAEAKGIDIFKDKSDKETSGVISSEEMAFDAVDEIECFNDEVENETNDEAESNDEDLNDFEVENNAEVEKIESPVNDREVIIEEVDDYESEIKDEVEDFDALTLTVDKDEPFYDIVDRPKNKPTKEIVEIEDFDEVNLDTADKFEFFFDEIYDSKEVVYKKTEETEDIDAGTDSEIEDIEEENIIEVEDYKDKIVYEVEEINQEIENFEETDAKVEEAKNSEDEIVKEIEDFEEENIVEIEDSEDEIIEEIEEIAEELFSPGLSRNESKWIDVKYQVNIPIDEKDYAAKIEKLDSTAIIPEFIAPKLTEGELRQIDNKYQTKYTDEKHNEKDDALSKFEANVVIPEFIAPEFTEEEKRRIDSKYQTKQSPEESKAEAKGSKKVIASKFEANVVIPEFIAPEFTEEEKRRIDSKFGAAGNSKPQSDKKETANQLRFDVPVEIPQFVAPTFTDDELKMIDKKFSAPVPKNPQTDQKPTHMTPRSDSKDETSMKQDVTKNNKKENPQNENYKKSLRNIVGEQISSASENTSKSEVREKTLDTSGLNMRLCDMADELTSQGISIKMYNKSPLPHTPLKKLMISRSLFFTALITTVFVFLEFMIAALIGSGQKSFNFAGILWYSLIFCAVPICFLIRFLLNPNRKAKPKKNFRNNIITSLVAFALSCILLVVVNFLLLHTDFGDFEALLNNFVLPLLCLTGLPAFTVIHKLIYEKFLF